MVHPGSPPPPAYRFRPYLAVWLIAALVRLVFAARPAPASGAEPHRLNLSIQPTGTTCTEAVAKGPNGIASVPATGATPIVLCAHVEDVATSTDQGTVPVEFRVTVGTVGASGTARYSGIVFSTAAGLSQISYRGDGMTYGTDTIVVTFDGGHAIASEQIEVTPATGRVASRLVVIDPPTRMLSATSRRAGDRFVSPTSGTSVALHVQDWRGLGVDDHVVLVRSEHGLLVTNPGLTRSAEDLCAGPTSRAIVLTSASTNRLAPGGPAMPGAIDFAVCADPEAAPGPLIVTVESISRPLPLTTIELTQGGAPTTIAGQATGGRVTMAVIDATGNRVADGTPVRFLLAPAAGLVAPTCVPSRDGIAFTTIALLAAEAMVVVSAEYNTTDTPATCAAPGTERVTAAVRVTATGATRTASDGGAGVEAGTSVRSD